MNQARRVLAMHLAREACHERTGELPAQVRSELALAAVGERIREQLHDPRSRTQRELDRLARETYEAPIAPAFGIIGNAAPATWAHQSFLAISRDGLTRARVQHTSEQLRAGPIYTRPSLV